MSQLSPEEDSKSPEALHKMPEMKEISKGQPTVLIVAMAASMLLIAPIGQSYATEKNTEATSPSNEPSTSTLTDREQSETCTHRYQAHLRQDTLPHASNLQNIADDLRQPSDDLPGRWHFWDGSNIFARTAHQLRLLATPQRDIESNRICTNQILARGGLIRCLKWEPIPAGEQAPPTNTPLPPAKVPVISPAEYKTARSLTSLVIHKGALQELAPDTGLYHLVRRSTDELKKYLVQPYRQALCSGAIEMVNFYRGRLKPVFEKAEATRSRLAEIEKTAASSLNQALRIRARQRPEPSPPSAATNAGSTNRERNIPLLTSMLDGLLTQPALTNEKIPTNENPDLLSLLRKASVHVTSELLETLSTEEEESIRKALRYTEFQVYATHHAKQFSKLDKGFRAVLNSIETNHRTNCSCNTR